MLYFFLVLWQHQEKMLWHIVYIWDLKSCAPHVRDFFFYYIKLRKAVSFMSVCLSLKAMFSIYPCLFACLAICVDINLMSILEYVINGFMGVRAVEWVDYKCIFYSDCKYLSFLGTSLGFQFSAPDMYRVFSWATNSSYRKVICTPLYHQSFLVMLISPFTASFPL